MARARPAGARRAWVGAGRRVVRSTRRRPMRSSRELSAGVTAGGDRRRRRAALTRLPASTIATKMANSSRRSMNYSKLWNSNFQNGTFNTITAIVNCAGGIASNRGGNRHVHRNHSPWDGIVGARPPCRTAVADARPPLSIRVGVGRGPQFTGISQAEPAAPDPRLAGWRSNAPGQQGHSGLYLQTLCAGQPMASGGAGGRRAGTALVFHLRRTSDVWAGDCAHGHLVEFSRRSRASETDRSSAPPLHERTSGDP